MFSQGKQLEWTQGGKIRAWPAEELLKVWLTWTYPPRPSLPGKGAAKGIIRAMANSRGSEWELSLTAWGGAPGIRSSGQPTGGFECHLLLVISGQ